MSTVLSLPKLRDAGHLEKFSTVRHALGLYHNITLSAYYAKSESSTPLESLVYRALSQVIAKYSVLSALPVDEDKPSAYFARLPEIDLRQVVTFVDRERPPEEDGSDADLNEALEREHNTDFKAQYGQLPFWRLVILRDPKSDSSFVACFIYHHAIGDGQSGLSFHRSFHAALLSVESVPSEEEFGPVVIPPDELLTPSLEDLHRLPLSLCYILRALKDELLPSEPSYRWTGRAISFADDKRKRQFTYITIPSETVATLLTLCRQHSVTLTALLEAMLARAVFANLPDNYTELHVDGAVSLKRFVPVLGDDSFGAYVSRYLHDHYRPPAAQPPSSNTVTNDQIWKEAQSVKRSIDEELGKNGKDSIVGLLRWAGPLIPFFQKQDGKTREGSFEFSNVGVFKYAREPTDESWRINQMVFGQSADVCGVPFAATLVTGGNGCLTIGFAWLEAMFEAGWMEQLVGDFKVCVINLARSS